MSEYSELLERGLRGGKKAKTKYEQSRPLRYKEMAGWVKRGYDDKLAGIKQRLADDLTSSVLGSLAGRKYKQQANAAANFVGEALRKLNHDSIERAALAVNLAEKINTVKMTGDDFYGRGPILDVHYKAGIRELVTYAAKATALSDFLENHPAQLGEKDKISIADGLESHWKLKEHDTVKKILDAEEALAGMFKEHQASEQDRALAVKWFAIDSQPKTLAEIEERLWGGKPKTAKTTQWQGEANHKTEALSALESLYPGLPKTDLKAMANYILHLELLEISTRGEMLEKLGKYKGSDPHAYLKSVHDAAVSKKGENNAPAPKGKEETQGKPPGNKNKPETPDELLDRLAGEDAKMTYPDHIALSKMTSHGRTPAGRLEEAIEHEILFRVANHLKGSGTHSPNIIGIAGRFPEEQRKRVEAIMHRLINQDGLIGAMGRHRVEHEALAVHPKLRGKYYDPRTYPNTHS